MESRSLLVKTRKSYNRLCCNKYVRNKAELNKLNEYFRNYLKKIPVRNISNGKAQKQVLPRVT